MVANVISYLSAIWFLCSQDLYVLFDVRHSTHCRRVFHLSVAQEKVSCLNVNICTPRGTCSMSFCKSWLEIGPCLLPYYLNLVICHFTRGSSWDSLSQSLTDVSDAPLSLTWPM